MMRKKTDKKKSIAETKKSICCTLLATGLLLQTYIYPAFADTSSQSISSSLNSSDTSDSDLQSIHDTIQALEAPTQAEDENIVINEHELNLSVGETFQLQLIDTDGSTVNNVKWFVRVRTPYDTLYTAESFNQKDGISSTIDDGLITAKAKGKTEVWSKWENALYKSVIEVKDEKETRLEKKVDEIADKFRYLSSDVDKVMAVHDYLIDHIEYSNEHIVSYAYGALIEGKAVCQGYSQSFQKILDKLKIQGRTIKGWSTAQKSEFHQWNRIKLDDGWYFVDVTWDDSDRGTYRRYNHFLVDSSTLGKNHRDWYSFSDEYDGTKYTYYAYKKQGILANSEEEIENILKAQINSSNSSNITVRLAIPKSIDSGKIISAIKKITGGNPYFNEVNELRDTLGTYQFYAYEVSNIPTKTQKNVRLTAITPTNNINETTTSVILRFDEDIDDLSVNDISMDEVHKTGVNKIDNKTYELTFKDMMFQNSKTMPIQVSKRGFNIANSRQDVDINIVKEEKPSAIFKATGDRQGRLENVESGMSYDLGDGIWHDINSSEPVNVTTKYMTPISVIRQSTTPPILNSDVQLILPKETREPSGIKTVDSVENKNNGKIIYVNKKMEYQKKGEQNWIACTGKEVTGLSEGKYLVRYKADGIKLASQPQEVTINAATQENNNSDNSNPSNRGNVAPSTPKNPEQKSEEQNKSEQKQNDSKQDTPKTSEENKKQKEQKEEKAGSSNGSGTSSSGSISNASKSLREKSKAQEKTPTTQAKQKEDVKEEQTPEKSQKVQSNQDMPKEIKVSDKMTVQEATTTLNNLKDVNQITWSKQAVIKVMQKGIMSGDTKGNFMPKKSVTRAETAQVIANILGEKPSTIKVADVDDGKWYAKAVQTVLENKIFTQDDRGNFRPQSKITRAELFVVISKLKGIEPLDNARAKQALSNYADVDSIPSWAIGYVSALVERGIVSGANSRINANDTLTREQLSTLLANIID